MNITCPACGADYNVDPTRIPATGLNMRCPKCSKSFSVSPDGQTTTSERVGGGTVLDGGGHSIKAEKLYVKRGTGKVFGPFDHNAIKMMLTSGKLGSDAAVSADKSSWEQLVDIPTFSQHIKEKPLPNMDVENPRATQIGWTRDPGADLPAAKGGDDDADLPTSKAKPPSLPAAKKPGAPPELPAVKSSTSSAGLPVRKASDLPLPKGSSGLPTPKGGGLPTPKADLPAAKADLPATKADLPTAKGELPVPAGTSAPLPVPKPDLGDDLFGDDDDDLFGDSSRGGDDDDLFGDSSRGGDDDLFGSPASEGDDDLFGSPRSEGDDDLFGAPQAAREDDDLFGSPASEGDIFGDPPPGQSLGVGESESDLFGSPSEASDDLFGSPGASNKSGDFLGGDAGFSFLDDNPAPAEDDWGDDLFSDEPSAAESLGSGSSAAQDWGDDLLDIEPRPAPKPKSTAPVLDEHDPFRPASAGIRRDEPAEPAAAADAPAQRDGDARRGSLAMVGGIVLLVALIGGGYYAVTTFLGDGEETVETVAEKGPEGLTTDLAKLDTYKGYAPLTDSKGAQAGGDGQLLYLQSMMLARYPNAEVKKQAEALAKKLDGAKDGWEALGRGAFAAQAGNADAARGYLEPLASGEHAFFANLAMGMGDTKAVLAEKATREESKPEPVAAPLKPLEVPGDEEAPSGTNAGGEAPEEGAAPAEGEAEAGGDEAAPSEPTPPAEKTPEKQAEEQQTDDFNGLVPRGYAALDKAIAADGSAASPYYWKGRLAHLSGDRKMAKEALKKAVELNPRHIASLVELGVVDYELGDLNDAIDRLEKVSGEFSSEASNVENARALHYGGLVHVARRQTDLAIESFTKALTIDPSRSDTLRALAEEYERAHKYKEALNFFTTNKNLGKDDPEVMLGIVRSHIGLEQWPQAVATLEEGQRKFPEDPQFPYYLGQLYMKRYAFADARKPLERAVEIDPTLLTAHATLALLAWLQDKDIPKAESHIETIVSYPSLIDAAVATQVADYYKESNNRPLAEQWYREALSRNPNHWPARLALSKLLLEAEEEEQARALLEQARSEGVQDVRLSAYLADAYRQAEDYDRAIDEINKVIEAFPKNEEYVFIRGRIHFDRGNFDTAQSDFQRAYDLNPRYHDAYFFVGRTAFERGDHDNALRIFRHVLDYKPDRGDYRFLMARTLEALNRETQALDEYRKATAVDPAYGIENPMVYVYRGRLLSRLGYSKEGKEDIARALELAPDSVEAQLAMGESDFRDKAYESAITNYKKALEREPKKPDAQYKLGMALLYTDRRQEAAQRLQLAIKYGYDDPEVYKRLGYLYRDLGQRSDARASFTKFLEMAQAKGNVPPATKREVLDQLKSL